MTTRRQQLMLRSESVTQKRFRFYLQNATFGNRQLTYTPDGWDKGKFQIVRHEKWRGLFTKLTINELTFVKDGRDFIRDCYEAEGINSLITFTAYRLNDIDQEYDVYFTGKLDLSTYMIDETGVKVQIIDDSFTEKIKNRENTKVNIRQRMSVGGFECTDWGLFDENPTLTLPEYNIENLAAWNRNTPWLTTSEDHYLPMLLVNSDFTDGEPQSQTISGTDPFFDYGSGSHTLRLQGRIKGYITADILGPELGIDFYLNAEGGKTLIDGVEEGATKRVDFDITVDESFTVSSADAWLTAEILKGSGSITVTTHYDIVDLTISETFETLPETTVIAYPIYEALLRVCQLIGDKDDALRSSYFGRTDTEIYQYPQDGRLGHISKGLFIRGAYALNNTLSLSLQEFYDTLSKVFCVGLGIESGRVVVEDMSEWFDTNVILDLSNVVREDSIGKEVLPTWHYSRIKTGYNSFEYLTVGGLSEYNTKSEYSTIISAVDNELDLVSRHRADTMGINLMRKTGPTGEDGKGDEDIWLIDSVRDTPSGFVARTDEDFIYVAGGVDAGQSYNLDLTPSRNLRRWSRFIRAGMEHYLNTAIRWQAMEKNSTLATQKTLEPSIIDEDDDILASELLTPYWYPEAYTVECALSYDDISSVISNPKGLVKLASGKYGWILEFSVGTKEDKAELKLLRCNTNYVTPVEI